MSRLSLSRRRLFPALAAVVLFACSSVLSAAQLGKIFNSDKNVKYQVFKDPSGLFELEYPEKDWKRLPSVGQNLVSFSRNDGPTFFVGHVKLSEPFTEAEIANLPAVELTTLKDQQPKATGFKSDLFESKAGRGVVIRYSREGAETVIQYSIAVGTELFRINGVIPDKQIAKYEPIVMYMIQSFKAPAGATPSK
ncbi:MAG TPA: hypothetical protein VFI56_04835 [Vicinamibacterales bacterium]|jgi:hypothetical protein|nr:hypothetical protein [Vicinamibacterales bacterium]